MDYWTKQTLQKTQMQMKKLQNQSRLLQLRPPQTHPLTKQEALLHLQVPLTRLPKSTSLVGSLSCLEPFSRYREALGALPLLRWSLLLELVRLSKQTECEGVSTNQSSTGVSSSPCSSPLRHTLPLCWCPPMPPWPSPKLNWMRRPTNSRSRSVAPCPPSMSLSKQMA